MAEGSSLLLITLDTTRADGLGCYGGPAWASPNLDRLAREGVRFEQARTVAPITLPAHASMLTGLYPFEHGARDNSIFRVPGDLTTLAEHLSRSGYSTGAVMGSFVLHSSFGLDQGFDVYLDVPRRQLETALHEDQRTADEVTSEALKLLQLRRLRPPFLLWVHYFDPHFPFEPPAALLRQALAGAPPESLPRAELHRRQYAAEVAFVDREIGRLLEGIGALLPDVDLLTAVVGDHGEGLWEHDELTHGYQTYDTTLLVPLILHHRRLPARVVEKPVSVIDLAPTLEVLLGVEPQVTTGVSLTGLVGLGGGGRADRPIYFETCLPYYGHRWSPVFGIVDGPMKLIEAPRPELYDVARDPAERSNLYGRHPQKVAEMRATFARLADRMRSAELLAPDEERQRLLQELGYTGGTILGEDAEAPVPGRLISGLRGPKEGISISQRCSRARALAFAPSGERRLEEAIALMSDILEEEPDNPGFLLHAGTIHLAAGNLREAADLLQRSIGLAESAPARCSLASALYGQGRRREAQEVLQVCVRLHPHNLAARLQLGELHLNQGRAEEALEQINAFLSRYSAQDQSRRAAEAMAQRARELLGG